MYSKLKKLMNTRQDDWNQYIDIVMFSMKAEHQMSTKYIPLEVMCGGKATHFMDLKEPLAAEITVS